MTDGQPKTRRYFVECNSKTPLTGAFNGECMVYFNKETQTGDRFFLTYNPVKVTRFEKDKEGRIVREWEETVEPVLPPWVTLIDEYEPEVAPKPIPRNLPLPHTLPRTPEQEAALRASMAEPERAERRLSGAEPRLIDPALGETERAPKRRGGPPKQAVEAEQPVQTEE